MKYVVETDRLRLNPEDHTKTIAVGSENWFRWLAHHDRFVYQGEDDRFIARREVRRGNYYWYGYRKRTGKLRKVYLGKASDLTLDKLIAANAKMKGLEEAGISSKHAPPLDLDTSLRAVVANAANSKSSAAANIPFALITQLTPPALPANLVDRPRLIQQINAPITLITAPSGFGKTTLLNQWREQCASPVAWVSLEVGGNDTHAFWTTVTVALQQIDPSIGHTVSILLQSPTPSPIEHLVASLIQDLNRWQATQPDRHLALIIDDYQRVQAPEIDGTCQFFLDHLPKAVQVIMASQARFPFAIQRWRGQGILTELTLDDLRLTPNEGIAWLERVVSIPLTDREKLSLVLRVEGWGAGLNLLAQVLKKREEVHRFIATFNGQNHYLQEYFVEEILRKHPPERQAFLLQTSILKNLNGPLCDAVTERTGSEQVLQHLYQANQFVTLTDKARGWYQYHDLFARALQGQLQQQYPHQISTLHRRAATWYLENELHSEAIPHLLAAGAWPEVAQLIDQVVLDELRRGSDHRVLKWLQQLPDELFLQHETLLFTYARLAMPSLPRDQVEGLLNRIAARIEAKPAAARTANEHALLARLSECKRALATGSLPDKAEPPSNHGIERLWHMLDLLFQSFGMMISGQSTAGEALMSQTIEEGKAEGMLFIVTYAGGMLTALLIDKGRLREGEKWARDILEWTLAETGSLPPNASVTLTILSRIHYARNQLAQARQLLDDAVMIDPHPTSLNIVVLHHVLLAHILNAQGDETAAHATLQAALDLGPYATSLFTIQSLKVHQSLLYVRQGRLGKAEHLLQEVSSYPLPAHQAGDGPLKIAWAELLLARHQYQEAEAILTQTGKMGGDAGLIAVPYTTLLLALAYWGQHKVNQARREMMRAIRLAEPEGMIRPFLDCGPHTIPLLTVVLHTEKLGRANRHFVTDLLEQIRTAYPDAPIPSAEEITARSISAQITPREQEILQLLDEGLDNKALAIRLVVTDSTVRTHLRNIYRKLGVNSRTQAIKRARELELL